MLDLIGDSSVYKISVVKCVVSLSPQKGCKHFCVHCSFEIQYDLGIDWWEKEEEEKGFDNHILWQGLMHWESTLTLPEQS